MDRMLCDISDFIFKKDKIEKAEIIFLPGGSFPEVAEYAADLYKQKYAPLLMPSGKYSVHNGKFGGALSKADVYNFCCDTESEFFEKVLMRNSVPQNAIILESEAVSTYDNARFSRKILDDKKIEIKKAILCCKSIHARRAFMYYQYYFPKAEILVCPVDIMNVSKENWFTTPDGISIVLQEVEKCGAQFNSMLQERLFPNETEKPNNLKFF